MLGVETVTGLHKSFSSLHKHFKILLYSQKTPSPILFRLLDKKNTIFNCLINGVVSLEGLTLCSHVSPSTLCLYRLK